MPEHHDTDTEQLAAIGLYRRVSTRHQLDNDRYASAFRDMSEVIQRHAGRPVIYDEGGHARSGATIRGRKVFQTMLADVANGALAGIAAPDVRSLSRGEWMIDGQTIADTLIRAKAVLITRDMRYDLRRPGDLRSFQDRLYWALQERTEVRTRFYQGQAARARAVVDGHDRAWGRHRTMLGHCLEVLLDDQGKPRITNRGLAKRAWAKDPGQAEAMKRLVIELDRQPTRGALFAALYEAGVIGPDRTVLGGWTKRGLETLLRSPFHAGMWPFVRTMRSTVWYGLDPRSDEFDASRVVAACPELAYWTPAQARRWEWKFVGEGDNSRRPSAERGAHAHPLLGLLRCPRCHELLLGHGVQGYICPRGAKGRRAPVACLPAFTVRDSSAQAALRELLPHLRTGLVELREAARAALQTRDSGALEVHLQVLDAEERALLGQLQALSSQGLEVPAAFTQRLVELAQDRRRTLASRVERDQVADARLEADQALAQMEVESIEARLGECSPAALAQLYRAVFAWVEVQPLGPGRTGGRLVGWGIHNLQTAGRSLVVDHLRPLLAPAA